MPVESASGLIAYFDCYSGISGDMTVGALLDCGLELADLDAALRTLPLPRESFRLEAQKVIRNGISGTQFRVHTGQMDEPHRALQTILRLIAESALPPQVQEWSSTIFRTLGAAEARIHGSAIDDVHFHEVGAIDAIVDIVGACYGLYRLGVRAIYASPLPSGGGMVRSAHGPLPVPAPATLALLAASGATLVPTPRPRSIAQVHSHAEARNESHDHGSQVAGSNDDVADPDRTELVTPTGAAILAALARFEQPPLQLRQIGYGFGTKRLPWANALRLWLGESAADPTHHPGTDLETDRVVVMETNIDNVGGEILGAALERIMAAGALDASYSAITMKKGRPAVALTVIVPAERGEELAALVLAETGSIGLRYSEMERRKAQRRQAEVVTQYGRARVKLSRVQGRRRATPEYEDCRRLADAAGLPLGEVYAAVIAAARSLPDDA